MGRAFEFRRARKEKRWGKMAKTFTKLSKEITMAVKQSGPDPQANLRLRTALLNAKGVSMPKDKVEGAIKRATDKNEQDYQEVVYEGYGPHGIAIVVECATDNPTRTVGNVRSYFTHAGGTLGTTGSLGFLFERKGVFRISPENLKLEEFELNLIDHGAEDVFVEEGEVFVYTSFNDFKPMQKFLEEQGVNLLGSELERVPTSTTELTEEQQKTILELVERMEEDEDVQAVFHTMK